MHLTVTPIYAAGLAILFIILSARVIMFRRTYSIAFGDGGNAELQRRVRAQANCAEYAPFGLILLLLMELNGAGWGLLHFAGATFLAGRVLHGYGISLHPKSISLRTAGMMLTLIPLGAMALILLSPFRS
jgi:uncharacterized protein